MEKLKAIAKYNDNVDGHDHINWQFQGHWFWQYHWQSATDMDWFLENVYGYATDSVNGNGYGNMHTQSWKWWGMKN